MVRRECRNCFFASEFSYSAGWTFCQNPNTSKPSFSDRRDYVFDNCKYFKERIK